MSVDADAIAQCIYLPEILGISDSMSSDVPSVTE